MPGYNGQRNCFLSTFKRDKLGCATPEDLRVIEEEQLVAHGGDARSDATLYGAPDGRTDVKIFEKLYGILPATIERISCIKTIAALDIHAGVVTSSSKTGSDKFYQLFWEFVRLLKESGLAYQEGYLDNGPADLVNAYHAFMGCIKTEVTVIAT
ncbi:hypothetical protein HOY82DRAFT_477328 [Tuber indicum]|nr:hypothetical protein HOY82DRAFT_477328 [Tuber indicum]